MNAVRGLLLAGATMVLTACAVGPDYKRPAIDAAASYKEEAGWKPSQPADAGNRGPWWQIFNDDTLDGLERQVDVSNETVKAAGAAVEEARALVREAQAGFWPTITGTASRQRSSGGALSPTLTNGTGIGTSFGTGASITNSAGISGTWDLDVWGQVRRSTESSRDSAQASAAALAWASLSAQAELASDYFQLRAQDQLQTLLDDTVKAQELSLKITQSRYNHGVAAKADVLSAQTQLLSTQAQQINAAIQRGILEHAIAVLIGQQPGKYSLGSAPMRSDVPTVPPGLPSALLERRPDVAQAERQVAAANAQIGVAKAAFFPAFSLTGSDEYSGSTLSKLLRASNQIWAFGPSITQTLFAGGLHKAQVAEARAAYEASVDNYRQTVLAGFQQVEDELVTLRVLERQAVVEDATVKAAREAEALTLNQYKAGTVPYSSVITAQTATLSSEETALTVLMDRLTASISMIQAVGGGWDASQLK